MAVEGGVRDAMSASPSEDGPQTLAVQLAHVRRYWWVVLGIVVLSVAGAVASTMTTPTTYTGRASLIVSSNNRAPDQDAVLVQGFVTYFNDAAYQSKLLAAAHVGPGVTVTAHAAAASPILLIDATSRQPDNAQSAAAKVAKVFRADMNRVHERDIAAHVAALRRQLERTIAPGHKVNGGESAITDLQDRIIQVQADQVNLLHELQFDGGVTQNSPRLSTNLLLALVGGLLIGMLAALAVGRLSNRLRTPVDLADKLRLNTLVEIPPTGTAEREQQRRLRWRQLANIVRARLSPSAVVAVTESTGGDGSAMVARALARQWAEEGHSSLLVRTSRDDGAAPSRTAGVAGNDENSDPVRFLPRELGDALNVCVSPGPVPGMWVLEPRPSNDGADQELSADSIRGLLAHTASSETLVVVDAPAVVDSPYAQSLCAAAGRTILVVEPAVSRVAATAEAVSVLEQSNAGLLGAVLVQAANEDRNPGRDVRRGTWGMSSRQHANPESDEGDERTEQSGVQRALAHDGQLSPVQRDRR